MSGGKEVQASGAVVAVRPRSDGTYGVTIGPGPALYWYVAKEAPKLGTDITVSGELISTTPIGKKASLSVLNHVMAQAQPPPYATRVVAPEWKRRVQAVMRRPLYRYQVDGAAWMAAQLAAGKSAILGDDPGLGKSTQTIAALCVTRMFPAIIVCPTSLKINWAREFGWAQKPPLIEIVSKRAGRLHGADVTILNPDLLRPREEQLGNMGARVIVFDEAHVFKKPKPSTWHLAAVATRLGHYIGRVLELTGTPIFNRVRDWWRLLHIADPKEWAHFAHFEERYCRAPRDDEPDERRRRVVTSYGRVENLDELHVRVEPVLLRRLKADVLQDLPPKSRRRIIVQLDELDMTAYRKASSDVLAWIQSQPMGDVRARAARRAQAIVKLTTLRHLAAQFKMRRAVPDYLDHWFDRDHPEPLVLFAFHKEIIQRLYGHCARLLGPHRVAIIGSADTVERRQAAVDLFNRGKANVFIAPIKCGGVGLNLQERCSDSLFVERLWEPTLMTQAEDRLHRIGALRPVTATYVDAADTIDEYIAEINDAKQTLIGSALDDPQHTNDAEVAECVDLVVDRYQPQ